MSVMLLAFFATLATAVVFQRDDPDDERYHIGMVLGAILSLLFASLFAAIAWVAGMIEKALL